MAHVVSAVQYVEGVIRDAAFSFAGNPAIYNNSLARWFAVVEGQRATNAPPMPQRVSAADCLLSMLTWMDEQTARRVPGPWEHFTRAHRQYDIPSCLLEPKCTPPQVQPTAKMTWTFSPPLRPNERLHPRRKCPRRRRQSDE